MTRRLWQLHGISGTLSCVVDELENQQGSGEGERPRLELRIEEEGEALVKEIYHERHKALIRSVAWRTALQNVGRPVSSSAWTPGGRPTEVLLWR